MRSGSLLFLVLLALFVLLGSLTVFVGCVRKEEVLSPSHRFELRDSAPASRERTLEKIGHELRPVVSGYPAAQISTKPDSSQKRILRAPLPGSFHGTERAIAIVRYSEAGRDIDLPPQVIPVRRDPSDTPLAILELRPRLQNGLPVEIVDLKGIPATHSFEHVTDLATVPEHARLEFGFGILDIARDQGAVEFTLQVCDQESCKERFRETLQLPSNDAPMTRGWQDRQISMANDAGRKIHLRLSARLLNPRRAAYSMPVWSTPILYQSKPRISGRRNIILISLDTLRADHLTTYGYRGATSPYLARKFGEQGVVFESLVASATTTGPAHMTMFTSLQPLVHGLGTGRKRSLLPTAATTLAEQLSQYGFKAGAFTENAAIHSKRGFARGFDEFAEDKGGSGGGAKGQIEKTLDQGLEWWRRHRDKDFFLFLHTYQTHAPYDPPAGYAKLARAGPGGQAARTERKFHSYDGEIRYTDASVERFLDTLEAEGMKDTVVIITSDHGEEFGEHGYNGHAVTLHQELTHVPLMLYGAGIPGNLRVAEPAAHIDLMPTILDLARVPIPDHAMGRSLSKLWQHDAGGEPAPVPIFSETWQTRATRADGRRITVAAPTFAVRLGARKLIRYRGNEQARYEYFDLASDPGETRDRFEVGAPEIAELMRLADDYVESMSRLRADLLERSLPEDQREGLMLDSERERKLRALGYVD
jgi:arylsulfatase A-like enzyme